ncbi:MAG: cyanoexosortase C [Cyanosarcina radialis HA8281-LM2]|jgi:exosortase|nr:cyanoexosortase C [Cyanosarcina radialis HA8281-LM2]
MEIKAIAACKSLWPSIQQSLKIPHNLITLCVLLVGLCYLPVWFAALLPSIATGELFPILVIAAAYFGLKRLWDRREHLAGLTASIRERRLGYILMALSVILFPFSRFAVWSQALLWVLILVGIALSSWGIKFFRQFPCPTFLLLFSAHPGGNILIGHAWRAWTPVDFLEGVMAQMSVWLLQAIGYDATLVGKSVELPTVHVEVGWSCNGLEMAIALGTAGLLYGIMSQKNRLQTAKLIVSGVVLAVVFNVIRIAGLVLALDRGEDTFEFWHIGLGTQIFSIALLSTYYFLVVKVFGRNRGKLGKNPRRKMQNLLR